MDQLTITSEKLNAFSLYRKQDIALVYELSPELNSAIEVALALNQPLLLTGEPGTGKTTLAQKIAADLYQISEGRYLQKPFEFHTKSNSVFTDLFYTYDAISHFYDANITKTQSPDIRDYIELNALGNAIAAAMSPDERRKIPARNLPGFNGSMNSVVLIDEVDKAPRDFPNDLLIELERYSFAIKEAGMNQFSKPDGASIFIILTSNGEKEFPEAFLRRCVYHKINFPDSEMLKKILAKHALKERLGSNLDTVLKWFDELRSICRNKKPATAELIAWCRILADRGINKNHLDGIEDTLVVIVKDEEDMKLVKEKWSRSEQPVSV